MSRIRGKKRFMTIKIDLENAYDRFRWDFIAYALEAVGIPLSFGSIILQCICTSKVQVL